MGHKAGEVPGFSYSAALKKSGLTWDVATMDAYLADPQKKIPGNKMPFPGLRTDNERNAVIAFLASTAGGVVAPAAAAPAVAQSQPAAAQPQVAQAPAAAPSASQGQDPAAAPQRAVSYLPGIRYTLRSGIADGRMVYIGVGGAIDGQVNPVLSAAQGQVVQVTLVNGEGAEHDIVFDGQGPGGTSPNIVGRGSSTSIAFVAGKAGDYNYFCSIPGHRLAGMEGVFLVTPTPPAQAVVEADISQPTTDVPAPIGKREPQTVRVDLVTVELEGRLAEGTTFGYWTFNGKVPGPLLRVRVGDTVDVHLKNADGSAMIHSVDFHAATGPGGGAVSTQANPGEEKSFKFKALVPGLYVYHCATPMVAHHIANGMYGMILVEPEEGLPPVDREFYVMQGEIYTDGAFGQHGSQDFNVEKLLNERPEYFVFNGSVGALSKFHPLQAKVGETVRIFFGVGGPNFTSSFHVIGEIFDKVYNMGSVLSEPVRGVQTVTVPPGGAVITEFKLDVPGNYILVDHALSRMERGLVGMLHVEGPPNPEIYNGKVEPGSGH
jgi:nitrite reductase (NO-forming)